MKSCEKQAQEFLLKTGTELKVTFVECGKHFDDDKEKRDIYQVTIKRGQRSFSFRFGQSLNCSMQWIANTIYSRNAWHRSGYPRLMGKNFREVSALIGLHGSAIEGRDIVRNKNFKVPTAHDVLASLQKYDVGTFEDFCDEFCYDNDSRRAKKTYKAVLKEWNNVAKLWDEDELEELHGIN